MRNRHMKSVARYCAAAALMLCFAVQSHAQGSPCGKSSQKQDIGYFLPGENHSFDKNIPTPYDVLGFNLGDVFVDYGDAVRYMETLDRISDKVSIRRFGTTWAGKTYMQVYISSEKNIAELESIRQDHLAQCSSASTGYDGPLVVDIMGAIHGNEASGATAPLIDAYYFTACQDKEVLDMLDRTVIIITPAQNPDGVSRFASWANYNSSYNHQADALQRESREMWPSSRSNHYFADCNRDWLAVQQPEGLNCVTMYQFWRPDVVLDMHEQGSTVKGFYFSPGDPNRTWKDVPEMNQTLTKRISEATASTLDDKGVLYFSGEGYDDYYIGKGAAYGDVQGSVCILHEQTASYGHLRPSKAGIIDFRETVRNQTAASISVVMRSDAMRDELIRYHRDFYADQAKAAAKDPVKAIRFSCGTDRARTWHLVSTLLSHGIDVYRDSKDADAYVVPMAQDRYCLIRAIFDKVTEFDDDKFYDISTWTFPCAYAAKEERLQSVKGVLGEKVEVWPFPAGQVKGGESHIGYMFAPDGFYTARAIAAIEREGLTVKVTKQPLTYEYAGQTVAFPAGSVMVPVSGQPLSGPEILSLLERTATDCGMDMVSMRTSHLKEHDLGSTSFVQLTEPKVAILAGRGLGISDTGEAWMLADARMNLRHSLIEYSRINKGTDLNAYNVMVIAGGSPTDTISPVFYKKIAQWVRDGGTLIASTGASAVLRKAGLSDIKADIATGVEGIIYDVKCDAPESPLMWGVSAECLTAFKMNANIYDPGKADVLMRYGDYVSGYASDENKAAISGSPLVAVQKVGDGRLVFFTADMNFRSYWFGTSRIFLNAIMYADLL